MPRPYLAALFAIAALVVAPHSVRATPRLLEDSTSVERWKLPNGLEVVVRNVPGARGVAVTAGFRAGSGYDPADRAGQAELLADVAFYGPAGGTPARTPEEMADLRPLGWGLKVNPRLALFTEIVSHDQLPGVLQQTADRMRGAAPGDEAVRAGVARVKTALQRRWFSDAGLAPYFRVAELARGTTDAQLVEAASGRALERLKGRDLAEAMRRYYNPSNAVLSLAGDVSGWDLHALVDAAFAALPAGSVQAEPVIAALHPAERVSHLAGAPGPQAAVALLGPSVEDSLHASFYLATLFIGSAFSQAYAGSGATKSHFAYSLFDEPELVRLFPVVPPTATEMTAVGAEMETRLADIQNQIVGRELLDRVRASVQWLLGGPMQRPLVAQLGQDAAGLGTLSTNQAARVLWKGDAFWQRYLTVFLTSSLDHTYWLEPLMQPSRQARLLLLP